MDPTLFNNLLSQFRNSIFSVVAGNGAVTQQLGFTLLSAITTIMTVFAGTRIAFHDHHAFHKLRTFTGLVILVWIMLKLYTTSSPLLGGTSFSQLIPQFAFGLADSIGTALQQTMIAKLNQILQGVDAGGFFAFLHLRDFFQYLVITLLVAALELAMFIVIAFGYIALGALVAVGPVLIPFMLIPKLDFLFWGWLKAMIKYSFYPVIGNLVLLVLCQLMLSTLNATILQNAPSAGAIALSIDQAPMILIIFIAGIYGVFKIPSLVSDLFSGAASAGHGMAQAAQSAIAAAVL